MGKSINLIAAISQDGFIGNEVNELPWILPQDLEHFKNCTTGGIVLMGHKTFESIGSIPLGNRTMWVLTRQANPRKIKGVTYFKYAQDVLDEYRKPKYNDRNLWVCGGAKVYEQFELICNKAFITRVYTDVREGIKFDIKDFWKSTSVSEGYTDNDISYTFCRYSRE